MRMQAKDIMTPANGITVVGLCLTIVGCFMLNTWLGLGLVALGKLCDNLDGFVARRTHTSEFGADMDALADKVSGVIILLSCWHFATVPFWFVAFCFLQHISVTILAVVASAKHHPLKVVPIGKYNMFLHICALLLFTAAIHLNGVVHSPVIVLAYLLAIAGVVTGLVTLATYEQHFRRILPK
jgi:phosphatidylglycerophosphate synthase